MDLAHVIYETMLDVLNVTIAPVIFSHLSAFALCTYERNVPGDVLRLVRESENVVMVSFYPTYTRCDDPLQASIEDVADHIQYIGQLIGYRHVGMGSDFDGMPPGILGLEDVSRYPDLIRVLLDRGVTVDDLAGVVGGIVLRVMQVVEEVPASMGIEEPLEDNVKPCFS